MTDLPHVTLCCIDTTARAGWSLRALEKCCESMRFAEVVFFHDESVGAHAPVTRSVVIPKLASVEAYSRFVIHDLPDHVATSHVLICQWDGYVLSAQRWRPAFMDLDYIGAPWTHVPPPKNVGNGGFSLRSVRLMRAVRDWVGEDGVHPEDWYIGVACRERLESLGFRFADPALAAAFSVEDGDWSDDLPPFGFHAPYHFPRVLASDEWRTFVSTLQAGDLGAWWMGNLLREAQRWTRSDAESWRAWLSWLSQALQTVPDAWCSGRAATGLVKALIRYGYSGHAHQLLRRRSSLEIPVPGDRRLRVRAWVTGWRDRCRSTR